MVTSMKKKKTFVIVAVALLFVIIYIGLCSRCYDLTDSDVFKYGMRIYGRNTIRKAQNNYLFLTRDPQGVLNPNYTEELKRQGILPKAASQVAYYGSKTWFLVEGEGSGLYLMDPLEGKDAYNSLLLYGKNGRAILGITEYDRSSGDGLTLRISEDSTLLVKYKWLGLHWRIRLKIKESHDLKLIVVEEG